MAIGFDGSASTDPDGWIVAYQWAFGDGQGASGMTTTHSYARPGSYTATLTVTDNKGLTNSDTANISVANRPPIANAGPDRTGAPAVSITFDGSGSSDPDGTIVSYAWTFGDGATGTGASPSHAYAAAGTYTATLTVTDDKGATASDTAQAVIGATTWARALGSTGADAGYDVAVDANGNVIVAGSFRGTVAFGPSKSLTSAGGADWFVAKYSSTNGLVWAQRMGGTGDDFVASVAVDASGDVIVTGQFTGSAAFGGPTSLVASGPNDMALAKYSGVDGAHVWSKGFGGAYDDAGSAVAVDTAGNVYLTGYFRGSIDFGTGTLKVPFDTDLDVFVAKFSSAGATTWAKNFVNTGNDRGYGIAVDGAGRIAVVGTFSNSIDFGGGGLSSPNGMIDAFVVKLDGNGAHLWSRDIGSDTNNEGANAVAVDGTGNVYLTGYAIADVDFGGGPLAALGGTDAFVAKYAAANGAHVWSRRLGGDGNDYGQGIAVDSTGNVVVTGGFENTAAFGGTSLTSFGGGDAFVARYSSTGAPVWARQLGGTSTDYGQEIALAPSGQPVVTGYFYGAGTFGGTTLTSAGLADAFVTSLAP